MWQDAALMLIGGLFAVFLIPLLIDTIRGRPVNRLSAATTAIGLYATSAIYITISLEWAAFSTALTGSLWLFMLTRSLKFQSQDGRWKNMRIPCWLCWRKYFKAFPKPYYKCEKIDLMDWSGTYPCDVLEGLEDWHCDWRGKCRGKPYMEIFPFKVKPEASRELSCDKMEFFGGWSYLCFRHFYIERFGRFLMRAFKRDGIYLAYGRAETADEYLDRMREDEFLYEEAEQEYLAESARAEAEAEAEAKALDMDRREQEVCDGEYRYGDR